MLNAAVSRGFRERVGRSFVTVEEDENPLTLRELRKRASMTQAAVATGVGLAVSTMNRIECGKATLQRRMVPRLASALRATVTEVEASGVRLAGPKGSPIGERIAAARAAMGRTQAAQAAVAGVKVGTWSRWETGEVEPSIARLQEISASLEVELSYFFPTEDSDIEMIVAAMRELPADVRGEVAKIVLGIILGFAVDDYQSDGAE